MDVQYAIAEYMAEYMRARSHLHTITLPVSQFYPSNGTFSTEFGVLSKDAYGGDTVSMSPTIILIYDYFKYTRLPGYAHYKSAKFVNDLQVSFNCFEALLDKRITLRIKKKWAALGYLAGPPYCTADDELVNYSKDDLTCSDWSSDEDLYQAELEDFWS
ncbi:hypothetical protein E8E13_004191 [Curvularia kusanoi]|uniref:Uncharacterized protein n=1 Tax=Curvularia kusanoi TaxID=90978 RepID=A0A9P4W9X3_CURKU|nr:hypothetical protein E8E13_004191 [Curvularia kusanoi]